MLNLKSPLVYALRIYSWATFIIIYINSLAILPFHSSANLPFMLMTSSFTRYILSIFYVFRPTQYQFHCGSLLIISSSTQKNVHLMQASLLCNQLPLLFQTTPNLSVLVHSSILVLSSLPTYLNWSLHIQHIHSKARQIIGIIYWNCYHMLLH